MVVLFVDPSIEARTKRTHLLAKSGLTVYEADGAEAAVAVAQQLKQLDVLVSEGVLDGEFTGFDVRDAIAQKFPALRSVFTSRYDLTGLEAVIKDEKVLYEPLDEAVLINQVLDGHVVATPAAEAAPASEVAPPSVDPQPVESAGPVEAPPLVAEVPAEIVATPEVVTEVPDPQVDAAIPAPVPEPIPVAVAEAATVEDDGQPRLQPGRLEDHDSLGIDGPQRIVQGGPCDCPDHRGYGPSRTQDRHQGEQAAWRGAPPSDRVADFVHCSIGRSG